MSTLEIFLREFWEALRYGRGVEDLEPFEEFSTAGVDPRRAPRAYRRAAEKAAA